MKSGDCGRFGVNNGDKLPFFRAGSTLKVRVFVTWLICFIFPRTAPIAARRPAIFSGVETRGWREASGKEIYAGPSGCQPTHERRYLTLCGCRGNPRGKTLGGLHESLLRCG